MTTKELDSAGRAADTRKDRRGTNEPWKRPGQASQNPDQKVTERRDLDAEAAEATTKTN